MEPKPDRLLKYIYFVAGIGLVLACTYFVYVASGILGAATYPRQYALQISLVGGIPTIVGILFIWAGLRIPRK